MNKKNGLLEKKIAWNNRSEFTKNILKLISGTVIAQLISIAVSPLLSRIYSPADFGLFTIVSSLFSVLALISGGRYEVAILLPKRHGDAANLLGLSLLINVFFCAFLYAVLLFLDLFFAQNGIGIWYYLLPVFVFFIGISQSLNAWYNRRKRYREIVYFKISSSLFNNGLSLSNYYLKLAFNGLLGAYLVSFIISVFILCMQLKADFLLIKRTVSFARMKKIAALYIRFPLINSLQSLLDALQINGLIYLIATLFGGYFVGIFSMALRILFVPMNFIGVSISQVFYQEASDGFNRSQPLVPMMRKTILRSLFIIAPVLLVLLLFGPQLFAFVLGKVWHEAGVYAQFLCPWICLDFIRAPLSQIPLILNKQKELLSFSIISNLLILTIVLIGGFYFDQLKTILLLVSFSQLVYLTILLFWIFKIASKHDKTL